MAPGVFAQSVVLHGGHHHGKWELPEPEHGRLALRKQPAHLAGGAFECHPIGSCPVKVHGRRVVLFPVENLSPVRRQKGHQPQSRRLRRSSFARVVHDCRPEWSGGISGPPAVRLHPASGRSPPASA